MKYPEQIMIHEPDLDCIGKYIRDEANFVVEIDGHLYIMKRITARPHRFFQERFFKAE